LLVARAAGANDANASLLHRLKAQGDAAMVERRYQAALEAYSKAASIEKSPVLDYNRGRALQALERYAEALDALESFQRGAPPELLSRVPRLGDLLETLRARVAELQIICPVSGAHVDFDGRPLGKTPLSGPIRLDAGRGAVRVRAEGYATYVNTITLTAGASQRLQVNLLPIDTRAEIYVTSPLPNAVVVLDGRVQGRVPVRARAEAGSHVVVVEHDGYDAHRIELQLAPRERRVLDVSLHRPAPLLSRWWFWTGVGVVLAGATVTTLALTTERAPERGDIAPGVVSAPLELFR
jgi:hypothetical protein